MKIGFTGAYCTANFGDWAMLVNNIEDINPSEIVVFTYNDGFPHEPLRHYFPHKKISYCEIKTRGKLNGNCETLTPVECVSNIANSEEVISYLQQIDVLCVNGGGYFDDNWCSRFEKFNKIAYPIVLAAQLGIRIVFMAQGIGPITRLKESMRFLFNYLPTTTTIGLRDEYCSPSYLQELGVDKVRLAPLPDDLLILNRRFSDENTDTLDLPGRYAVMVLSEPIEQMLSDKAAICEVAATLKQQGLSLVALPFDLNQFGEHQAMLLQEWLPDTTVIGFNGRKFIPIETVYTVIRHSECVVTTRYHAMIIAMQADVPFFVKINPVQGSLAYYYNKYHGSLRRVFGYIPENQVLFSNWNDISKYICRNNKNYPPRLCNHMSINALSQKISQLATLRHDFINRNFYD